MCVSLVMPGCSSEPSFEEDMTQAQDIVSVDSGDDSARGMEQPDERDMSVDEGIGSDVSDMSNDTTDLPLADLDDMSDAAPEVDMAPQQQTVVRDDGIPKSCDTICAEEGLICDVNAIDLFGLNTSGRAEYERGNFSTFQCDTIPDETDISLDGTIVNIISITCKCVEEL